MKFEKAVKILERHNKCRRGAEIEPSNQTALGIAIDLVIKHCKEFIKIEEKKK